MARLRAESREEEDDDDEEYDGEKFDSDEAEDIEEALDDDEIGSGTGEEGVD